ncbi:ABC-type hemin transport system substrate-binding protein [Endozoicomonas sp. NE35]
MKALKRITMIMIAALFSTAAQAKETSPPRIISAGNGITEIIYALGAGDQLIAVDSTSVYPAEVHRLPKLGYHKQLSAEGILAMNPSILVGTDDMGPPATIEQLKGAGLTISALPLQNNADNIQLRIESLAKLLDREQEGKRLWKSVSESLSEARAIAGDTEKAKSTVYAGNGWTHPFGFRF